MGHIHYWYLKTEARKEVEKRMPLIVEDFARLLPHLPPLAGPAGEGEPVLETTVAFNGPIPNDYESFVFPDWTFREAVPKCSEGDWAFSFCKTGFSLQDKRPYDLAVRIFLLVARIHLGDLIRLSSDAPLSHWVEPASLIEERLSLPVDVYTSLDTALLKVQDGRGKKFLVEAKNCGGWEEKKGLVLEAIRLWEDLAKRGHYSWPFKGPYRVLGERCLILNL